VWKAEAWYEWLWIGPARAALAALGLLLFVLVCAVALALAFLLSGIAAAPFHDELSRRVERLATGRLEDRTAPGLSGLVREGARAVLEEARRMGFFLAVQLGIVALGLVLPGGALLAPPAMTLLTIFFLPLDYASYTLDRRRMAFRDKRRWLGRNRSASLGFGAGAFLTCLVPGLNVLAGPLLVVGGTLLVLRNPP
jgi:CysZ protein